MLVQEIGNFDGCDMEEFGWLESSENAIAILRDRWRLALVGNDAVLHANHCVS